MAFVFTDAGDSYAATSDLTKVWSGGAASPWAFNVTAGRNGGGGLQAVGGTGGIALASPTGILSGNLVAFGFWMMLSAAPAAVAPIIVTKTSAQSNLHYLQVTTGGILQLLDGNNNARQTGVTNVADNKWHWIEWYAQNPNNALNKLYVDTNQEWNANTASAVIGTLDRFELRSVTSRTLTISWVMAYDDTSANTPTTSSLPLGPQEMQTLRPASDSAVQFTPDTGGVNFSRVNETTADGDTSYVQSGTSGNQDLYGYGSLSGTPGTINGVMAHSYLYNPSPGVINFQQLCKSNLTTTTGTSVITPSAYQMKQQPFNNDPNTSAAWTASGLNSATFGIKVV